MLAAHWPHTHTHIIIINNIQAFLSLLAAIGHWVTIHIHNAITYTHYNTLINVGWPCYYYYNAITCTQCYWPHMAVTTSAFHTHNWPSLLAGHYVTQTTHVIVHTLLTPLPLLPLLLLPTPTPYHI
jgi:hypothetical protein